MALPTLTAEQRAEALAKAAVARRIRAEQKERLRTGDSTLAELFTLGEKDDAVGKMKVTALLEALPGVGKVRAAKIMAECEISPNRRVRGLGVKQRAALQVALGV